MRFLILFRADFNGGDCELAADAERRSRNERRKRREQDAILFVQRVHAVIEIIHLVFFGEAFALGARELGPVVIPEELRLDLLPALAQALVLGMT